MPGEHRLDLNPAPSLFAMEVFSTPFSRRSRFENELVPGFTNLRLGKHASSDRLTLEFLESNNRADDYG